MRRKIPPFLDASEKKPRKLRKRRETEGGGNNPQVLGEGKKGEKSYLFLRATHPFPDFSPFFFFPLPFPILRGKREREREKKRKGVARKGVAINLLLFLLQVQCVSPAQKGGKCGGGIVLSSFLPLPHPSLPEWGERGRAAGE